MDMNEAVFQLPEAGEKQLIQHLPSKSTQLGNMQSEALSGMHLGKFEKQVHLRISFLVWVWIAALFSAFGWYHLNAFQGKANVVEKQKYIHFYFFLDSFLPFFPPLIWALSRDRAEGNICSNVVPGLYWICDNHGHRGINAVKSKFQLGWMLTEDENHRKEKELLPQSKTKTQIKQSKTSPSFEDFGKALLAQFFFFQQSKKISVNSYTSSPFHVREDTWAVMKVIFMLSRLSGLNIERNFGQRDPCFWSWEERCLFMFKIKSKPPIHLKLAIHWDLRTMIFLWVPNLHQMWCWFPG